MKNFELLTLSVVAATLVTMTGCSSDDDDSSSASGPSAPSEISTPVELNASAARNAMALIYRNGRIRPAPLRVGVPDNDRNTSTESIEVRDCDISGTETTTYTETNVETDDAGWSYVETESTLYDNCIDNDVAPYDTRTRNGSYTWTEEEAYDPENNTRTSREYELADYTDFSENNNSKISEKTTYDAVLLEDITIESTTTSYTKNITNHNGERHHLETAVDGDVTDGYREVYGNLHYVEEEVSSVSKKLTVDGFRAYYDTNSSGVEKLSSGTYVKNYKIHWYKPENNYREEAVTISGTIGDLCLGGSITISTNPVVRSNQFEYYDKDGNTPGSHSKSNTVLPYSGQQQITGINSATITYDYNSTKNTSATVNISGESKVYGTWNEFLADNSCGN